MDHPRITSACIRTIFDNLNDLGKSRIITEGLRTWSVSREGWTARIDFEVVKTRHKLKRTFLEPTAEKLQETVMAAIKEILERP